MGTVEFTGLAIMRMLALGAWSAAALAKSRTMEALVLNKSVNNSFSNFEDLARLEKLPSRVIPGLRGTPAGMRTISAPSSAAFNPSGPEL